MNQSVPEVETARLRLRPFRDEDFEQFATFRSDAAIMKYIGTSGPQSRERTVLWLHNNVLRWQQHELGMWAVVEKSSGAFAGWCGLGMLDGTPEVEVGYGLAQEFWGQGIATEAARASLRYGFEERRLERIVAVAMPDNLASRRVMEKLGMRYERDARYYNADVVYYAITRAEFQPGSAPYTLRAASEL